MKRIIAFITAITLLGAFWTPQSVHAADDTLKIGLMPSTDSIPFLWAQEKGYFKEAGLDIELVPFTNAKNRSTAMQTGEIQGEIVGLNEYFTFREGSDQYGKIVMNTPAQFELITGKDAKGENDKIKVGSMDPSIIHYLTSLYFKDHPGGYEEEIVPEVPARIQLLAQGQLDYAILPEPIASSAQAQGLKKERLELPETETLNVLVLSQKYLDVHSDQVKKLHEAFDKAVADLQDATNQDEARALLVSTFELPEGVSKALDLPTFKPATLPTKDYVEHVREWVQANYDGQYAFSYDDMVQN